jgi:PhnB protein
MKRPSPKKVKKAAASKRAKPAPKKAAKKKVAPIPPGYHTLTPFLSCRRAAEAIEFYKKAFGAKELHRMPMPDGTIAHAEVRIGDSRVALGDEMPAMGAPAPQSIGGTPVQLFLYVKDVDKAFAQATSAGATTNTPPTDMFWGDRYCTVTDPFGHRWAMATHIEDMSPREMARRGALAMAPTPPTP